ncbi:MAG: PQQ-dependent sugar dehydrogenase, partial [Planctomycetales bacterium]|nr:PQQ-dependent sugar dehydrogenase [Planctomycetales bacterium]
HDITAMTIDPQGRVVVSGPGYVKTLHDADEDGRAESATVFADGPAGGAHGMLFTEDGLLVNGDNLLARYRDSDGDGRADGKPFPLANVGTTEHGASGLTFGPDGWIYFTCGNEAGVGAQLVRTKTSPVHKPQAGAIVRFSPDFAQSEVFAHGFRNPYDLAFNSHGHLFTVDSDGERDQYLPWYAPTRLFDVQQGAHHGWVQGGWTRSWNRPASFFDNVERLVEIGRGSPTGVECYRHDQFPPHYRDGVFSCCWTLGRVYHFPLAPRDATYEGKVETFLRTTGDVGFAPVDVAVGPQGDLFVAIGGRGPRGSVFRVRYVGEQVERAEKPAGDLEAVLRAPQPLAAWSRAKWLPVAKKIPAADFIDGALSAERPSGERIRALEVLCELHGGPPLSVVTKLAGAGDNDTPDDVAARAVWAAARSTWSDEDKRRLAGLALRRSPAVQRAVWEAGAAIPWVKPTAESDVDIEAYAARRVHTARLAASLLSNSDEPKKPEQAPAPLARLVEAERRALTGQLTPDDFACALALLPPPEADAGNDWSALNLGQRAAAQRRIRRDAVRLLQLCLGDIRVSPLRPDVYAGYTANRPQDVAAEERAAAVATLTQTTPTDDDEFNREAARLLGMLEVESPHWPAVQERLSALSTETSSVQDDLHYLIVISRLPGERTTATTSNVAAALAGLHHKMAAGEMIPSRNWPLRVSETFTELCRRDPGLPAALAQHAAFGLPQHAMFAQLMPPREKTLATQRMLARALEDDETTWTSDMVRLIARLDDPAALEAIRLQWADFGLRGPIIAALAEQPRAADRDRFFEALSLADAAAVTAAANAITMLGAKGSPKEIGDVVAAL